MNLKNQIKKHRIRLSLSQEELGEKIFVTRQTVSNWENGKNYPDINSLILLSSLFNTSIDELVKGDIKEMKEFIDKSIIYRMKMLSIAYTIGFIILIVSPVPLVYYFGWIGLLVWALIVAIAFIPAIKIEKIKKENDIQTYKEIVAFMDGKKLDEIQKATERGKRNYQKVFSMLVSAVIGFLVAYFILKLIGG